MVLRNGAKTTSGSGYCYAGCCCFFQTSDINAFVTGMSCDNVLVAVSSDLLSNMAQFSSGRAGHGFKAKALIDLMF